MATARAIPRNFGPFGAVPHKRCTAERPTHQKAEPRRQHFWRGDVYLKFSVARFTRNGGMARDALEGKAPPRRPLKPLNRRLEEVAKAVGGGYCRLQMPLRLALAVRGTVAGRPGRGGGGLAQGLGISLFRWGGGGILPMLPWG